MQNHHSHFGAAALGALAAALVFWLGSMKFSTQVSTSQPGTFALAALAYGEAALFQALGSGEVLAGPGIIESGTAGSGTLFTWNNLATAPARNYYVTVQNLGDTPVLIQATASNTTIPPGESESVFVKRQGGESITWGGLGGGTAVRLMWVIRDSYE